MIRLYANMVFFCCLLGACVQDTSQSSTRQVPELEIVATVQSPRVASGEAIELHIELYGALKHKLEHRGLQATGLHISRAAPSQTAQMGNRQRKTFFYSLSGANGSYIIQPGILKAGEQEVSATPIFVDIGVVVEEAKLEQPIEPQKLEMIWYMVGGVVCALLIVVAVVRQRHRNQPVLSAAKVALQRWEEVKKQQLNDHDLAVHISLILRTYLDSVLSSQTMKLSPLELQEWVMDSRQLQAVEQQQVLRLLRITDQLKFAGEQGGHDLFDRLGRDLVRLIRTLDAKAQEP